MAITVDPTVVLQTVADSLQKDVASLNARWGRIVAKSIQQALVELNNILRNRGYSDPQIAAWDDGAVYAEMLATFFTWVNGAGLEEASDQNYSKLDCRESLRKMLAISIGGVMVGPGQSGTGSPAGGGNISNNGVGSGIGAGGINVGQVAEFVPTMYFPSERRRLNGYGRNYPPGGCM